MKRVTATEARKNWFRLLDEVAEGEVVLIEREGARLLLKLAEQGEPTAKIPDYRGLIEVPDANEADQWGWEWEMVRPKDYGLGAPNLSHEGREAASRVKKAHHEWRRRPASWSERLRPEGARA